MSDISGAHNRSYEASYSPMETVRFDNGGTEGRSRRVKAIAALSTLVGAVSMARAVNDENLSHEILKAAADELKVQLAV